MFRHLFGFIAVFIFMLFSGITVVASEADTHKPLPLDRFVQLAIAKNPFVQKTHAQYVAELKQAAAAGGLRDWNLIASYTYQNGLTSTGFPAFASDGIAHTASVSLTRLFPETGTQLSLNPSYTVIKNPPSVFGFPSPDTYQSAADIRIKQPLLRNAFGIVDRTPLILADYEMELARLKHEEDMEDWIYTLVAHYMNWLSAKEVAEKRYQQYQKADKQVAIIDKQRQLGAAEELDLVLAKQNKAAQFIAYQDARLSYDTLSEQISGALAASATENRQYWEPVSIVQPPAISTQETAISHALGNTRTIQTVHILTDMTKVNARYYDQLKKPELSVIAALKSGNIGSDRAKVEEAPLANPEWQMGVEWQQQLGNTTAKSQWESAQAAVKVQETIAVETQIGIRTLVQQLYRQQTGLDAMISSVNALIALGQRAENLEMERYKKGRSYTVNDVLSIQTQIAAHEVQLIQLTAQRDLIAYHILSLTDGLTPQLTATGKAD